jgi:hypothetical protein
MKALLLLAVLLATGLAGCSNAPPTLALSGLFQLPAIERGAARPEPVGSCADLLRLLDERALTEARVALERSVEQGGSPRVPIGGEIGSWAMEGEGDVAVPMAAAGAASASAPAASSSASPQDVRAGPGQLEATGTNNQEHDADEADLVKTDGGWTYLFAAGRLRILHADHAGEAVLVANVDLDGSGRSGPAYGHAGGSLLLIKRGAGDADDRLVLLLPNEPAPSRSDGRAVVQATEPMTRILVLELGDRTAPSILSDRWIEGQLSAAHLVDGTVYAVVHKAAAGPPLLTVAAPTDPAVRALGLPWSGLGDAQRKALLQEAAEAADASNQATLAAAVLRDHLPATAEVRQGIAVPGAIDEAACRHVVTVPEATGRGISTILALDAQGDAVAASTTQVVGDAPMVYASESTLVLASASQGDWWYWQQPSLPTTTDLQTFHLDGLTVTPGASGAVPGLVLDTFALDVHDGQLRVVSATGTFNRGWMAEGATSPVTALTLFKESAGVLVPTGAVGGIAPGERLWSVRFTDARAYIVTFHAMDPLWVVDLTGSAPEVVGELHVAGVSTYVHPVGDDRLLSIGYGGGDDGLGLDESRIVVALFDVADPAAPRQLAALDLTPDHGYAYTSALHEHKAFTYWDALHLLAVPLTSSGASPGGGYRSHQGLALVDVDRDGLALRGRVDQDALSKGSPSGYGDGYGYGGDVERSWFVREGDAASVYALSEAGVTAHDLATLEAQGSVAFR